MAKQFLLQVYKHVFLIATIFIQLTSCVNGLLCVDLCSFNQISLILKVNDIYTENYLCHKPHMIIFTFGLWMCVYVQVGIQGLARRQLLPWQWEVPESSLLAETWTRLRRRWGRSSSRVTAWTSSTWSWTWPTCALSGSSVRASFRERRGSTSSSIVQVRGPWVHHITKGRKQMKCVQLDLTFHQCWYQPLFALSRYVNAANNITIFGLYKWELTELVQFRAQKKSITCDVSNQNKWKTEFRFFQGKLHCEINQNISKCLLLLG